MSHDKIILRATGLEFMRAAERVLSVSKAARSSTVGVAVAAMADELSSKGLDALVAADRAFIYREDGKSEPFTLAQMLDCAADARPSPEVIRSLQALGIGEHIMVGTGRELRRIRRLR